RSEVVVLPSLFRHTPLLCFAFSINATTSTEIYTLSLHDALPIYFNCRGFGPLLEDKLCLIFKLAPSVCRMTFPILASVLVRLVVLLPFQLLRSSLAPPSSWTPLAHSVFLHGVLAVLLHLR